MIVLKKVNNLVLIKSNQFHDNRGYFSVDFNSFLFNKVINKKINFIQDNVSYSRKNVFRGMHYQVSPFKQNKLIKVIKGKILDLALDLNKKSRHYGKIYTFELSESNRHQLFIPDTFAHGFIVKSNSALIQYKVDNKYSTDHERGFNLTSFEFYRKQRKKNFIISNKDKLLPDFVK
jgi:dTDP-4-dehydrorhamnose 3,5-epimerase